MMKQLKQVNDPYKPTLTEKEGKKGQPFEIAKPEEKVLLLSS